MRSRILSDQELSLAAGAVRDAMLHTLPQPQECTGTFSSQFEEKIEHLKHTESRKESRHRIVRGAAAAVLAVLLGLSMLVAFNTDVHAAVVKWFKETFGTYTTYWFDTEEEKTLPEYELTWVPEGYEVTRDLLSKTSRHIEFQNPKNELDVFIVSFCMPQPDSPLFIDTFDSEYAIEEVNINGYYGEFYRSLDAAESHALVWLDENTNTAITILAFFSKEEILQIANNVELVE